MKEIGNGMNTDWWIRWVRSKRTFWRCAVVVGLWVAWGSMRLSLTGQGEVDPGLPPDFVPAPPPNTAEILPFPSNVDNTVAMVAFVHDPERQQLILSVDSQSNREFVLQSSTDLEGWEDTVQSIVGNKTIITFVVPIPTDDSRYFRVVKR